MSHNPTLLSRQDVIDIYNDCLQGLSIAKQIYFKLMDIKKGIGTDKNMLKTLEFNLSDDKCDYWWWIDAIHMALPFYNMLGTRFNDERYFEKTKACGTAMKIFFRR